jgi:hypothetical protein
MLPQTNGTILSINADGNSDDWDESAGAGTSKVQGPIRTYVKEKVRTVFSESAGGLLRFRDITLYVDETIHPDLLIGDIITYQRDTERSSGRTHTRRIQEDTNPTMPTIPTGMSYRQLVLETASVES